VEESWNQLIKPFPSDKALQIILIKSGPVPFHLKKQLYDKLINDQKWHVYIFKSILHSRYDLYGELDVDEGERILNQLVLPADTQYLDKLKKEIKIPKEDPYKII